VPPTLARIRSAPVIRPRPPPAPVPRLSDCPRKPRRWPDSQFDYYISIDNVDNASDAVHTVSMYANMFVARTSNTVSIKHLF